MEQFPIFCDIYSGRITRYQLHGSLCPTPSHHHHFTWLGTHHQSSSKKVGCHRLFWRLLLCAPFFLLTLRFWRRRCCRWVVRWGGCTNLRAVLLLIYGIPWRRKVVGNKYPVVRRVQCSLTDVLQRLRYIIVCIDSETLPHTFTSVSISTFLTMIWSSKDPCGSMCLRKVRRKFHYALLVTSTVFTPSASWPTWTEVWTLVSVPKRWEKSCPWVSFRMAWY